MQRRKVQSASRIIPVVALLMGTLQLALPSVAHAAGFNAAFIRLDRMKANTTTGGTVCANPATTATEGKVVVTFPTTYTLNTTAANWTVTTTNMPVVGGTTATAWVGIGVATSVTTAPNVVTFTSGDLTPGTMYCFNFSGTSTLTTAAAAATNQQAIIATQTAASADIDATNIALANITDDQIVVNATVPPSFAFVLSGNTDTFATLDPASIISTTGRTVTVTTNAKGGWIAWAKDSTQGLHSVTASYTIPSLGSIDATPTTLTGGSSTESYQLDVDLTTDAAGGCTLTIDPEYNGTGVNQGGTFSANFQRIAYCNSGSPATANGDVITLIERATIAGATPAASDYTDTITVVGAGNF